MKKAEVKAGIIGSGFAAKFHVEALKRVSGVNVEIVGAYSRNADKLKQFCAEKDIRPFESLDALINASDVLHLCTPPVTHEPIGVDVLKQNKSVIIEKPLTGFFWTGHQQFKRRQFPGRGRSRTRTREH